MHDPHFHDRSSYVIAGLPPTDEITLGRAHGCARTRSGEVWCWGLNEGQLGRPRPVPAPSSRSVEAIEFALPRKVSGLANIVQLAAGDSHNCARASDGSVWCWGKDAQQAPPDPSRVYPHPIPGITSATDLAVGSTDSCAVLENGRARCWDAAERETTDLGAKFGWPGGDVRQLVGIDQIDLAADVAVARGRDGTVQTAPLFCSLVPVPAVAPGAPFRPPNKRADTNAANDRMPALAPRPAGWTAGSGGTWAKVPNVEATVVAADYDSACAVTSDKRVVCWGRRACPNGPTKPALVPHLTDVSEVATGGGLTCALRTDESVLCWGTGTVIMSEVAAPISL